MYESQEKYYYFPTMTKNIMFIRGEKYVCLCDINKMIKNHIYTVKNFTVHSWNEPILFVDTSNNKYYIHPFECGYFKSLKQYRKDKLKKLEKS